MARDPRYDILFEPVQIGPVTFTKQTEIHHTSEITPYIELH